jgi:hypothetical protein
VKSSLTIEGDFSYRLTQEKPSSAMGARPILGDCYGISSLTIEGDFNYLEGGKQQGRKRGDPLADRSSQAWRQGRWKTMSFMVQVEADPDSTAKGSYSDRLSLDFASFLREAYSSSSIFRKGGWQSGQSWASRKEGRQAGWQSGRETKEGRGRCCCGPWRG